MQEIIEEYLEDNFEFIKITVKYKTIKTYEIILELFIQNNKEKYTLLRTSFEYVWSSHSTNETNLSSIKHYVNQSIKKMFEKEVKE